MIKKTKKKISRLIRFLTYDIWRIGENEVSALRNFFYDIIKSFILTFRNINGQQLNTKAAALTYRSLLSIVPLLAVLFAIARGFGFQNIVSGQLFNFFSGQKAVLEKSIEFIDTTLEYAQGGVFLGVGIVLLLYTVINLLSSIETSFNDIWGIKKSRSYFRMFTDYLALIIILPVSIIGNAGFSIVMSAAQELDVIGDVISPFMTLIPYAITIVLFTFVYIYIPNTRVKFKSALISGVITGIAFQVFQLLYISGQIWISKYNAIYGSFAALPLLLLWMHISWFICLIGVELTFANQNVKKFAFETETKNISRRYKDFVILVIMRLIVKRFETGGKPYTADNISSEYHIPSKLTTAVLFHLQDIGLILETNSDDDLVPAYIPAIDINQITIGYMFDKMSKYGSENFRIDRHNEFEKEWNAILGLQTILDNKGSILIKDL